MNDTPLTDYLKDLDLPLDQTALEDLGQEAQQELNTRIGAEIIDYLSDEELTEYLSLVQQEKSSLGAWLQGHVPDLAEIVEDEMIILLGEIAEQKSSLAVA